MAVHLYLSMIPESLVASMLPPQEFGTYLAVGTAKRSHGQAIFLDLEEGFESECFDLAAARARCVPKADGSPKHSVYLAIYRVLEHVPLDAVNSLWLATPDGRVLELRQGEPPEHFPGTFHLYQEICPVHPLIASKLEPVAFCRSVTDPSKPLFVPRICFVDLDLAELADDPDHGRPTCLPYHHLDHLRDCLLELEREAHKHTKTVDRIQPQQFPYRCVRSGFFLGDRDGVRYYPFPSLDELESRHYTWWRSASE